MTDGRREGIWLPRAFYVFYMESITRAMVMAYPSNELAFPLMTLCVDPLLFVR